MNYYMIFIFILLSAQKKDADLEILIYELHIYIL